MTALTTAETSINVHQFELLNGDYPPADAIDMINQLIDTRINFLKVKNLSQQVRYNRPDNDALQEIDSLRKTKESICQTIREAEMIGRSLTVKSSVTIIM